ncbi:MAG: leucine-rich repeat domain-containing protein, partial [Bacteroidetes bacterium]|nr:leucine-rich repeat domain-containing protein [Bacteroidota bacterium]
MNNEFYKILQFLIVILLIATVNKGFTQEANNDSIAKQKMETLEQQVTQLIGFLEYSMNTLGTKSTPAREKETIIQESYRKIFANDKVQIEDDLDDKREAIVNKDVQAYLKDINFFFRDAAFTLNINKITPQYNEHGGLFFIADIDRHLEAVTVSGDTMDNSLQRFIEFNYDEVNQDLKIASIYTTKLNENEEMSYWWNNLPESWKIALGKSRIINDSLTLAGIAGFTDSAILISRKILASSLMQKDQTDTSGISLPAVLIITDTIPFNTDKIFYLVRQILNLTEISVEKDTAIFDLQPLSQLRNLKKINCSYTGIQDLTPIRNLSQLEVIDCSHTKVSDFSVLRFSGKLRDLDAGYTAVSDLAAFSAFTELERLNLDSNNIVDLSPLSSLTKIRDLRFRGTWVDNLLPLSGMSSLTILDCSETRVASLEPLKNLTTLERLYCSSTRISDLSPLSGLSSLKSLNIDNTPVSSLDPLNNLSELEKIYCDNTGISGKVAGIFMEKHPQVLVIYESQTLINWWNELTPEWQNVFASYIQIDPTPTKEQLHEIANLTQISIQNKQNLKDLEPLKKLEKLESLDISFTIIDNLAPLNDLVDLKKLNCKQSRIKDLSPLEDLINLESLDISVTAISNIEPLRNLNNLQVLTMDETAVADLEPLSGSRMIRLVYCDQTPIG